MLTESVLTGANSTGAGTFFRVHSPNVSTSWKKIAQINLPDLPLFASLISTKPRDIHTSSEHILHFEAIKLHFETIKLHFGTIKLASALKAKRYSHLRGTWPPFWNNQTAFWNNQTGISTKPRDIHTSFWTYPPFFEQSNWHYHSETRSN